MARLYYSIFNDALGPVMNGPSSSHTAGCCRIGLETRYLYGKEITRADIVFEEKGSYPSTYVGQGSNFGFTGGLLGFNTDDQRLKDAVKIAKDEGRQILFKKEALGFKHPNQAEIRVFDSEGKTVLRLMTFSIGGGMFLITKMDEFDVMIDGGQEQYFVCTSNRYAEALEADLKRNGCMFTRQSVSTKTLFTISMVPGQSQEWQNALKNNSEICYIRRAAMVLPIAKNHTSNPPFFNAEEAEKYAKSHDRNIWQLAYDYESGYGYTSEAEIDAIVKDIRVVMERSTVPPDPEHTTRFGFLPYQSVKMKEHIQNMQQVDTGTLQDVMFSAIAVMENSCAHNIIVAAPTAGSSGVVPASVVTVGRKMGKQDEEIDHALLAAGLIGVFIANQATFAGEVGACQAENGSAAAMAAAGVCALLGGSVKQIFKAASMALQNVLGLICDPVAGLTEIPCISRNVSSASDAVFSANMVMLGFDPVIPLDETIDTMKKVGSQLPAELRCTCRGGLCATKTGCNLQAMMDRRRAVL